MVVWGGLLVNGYRACFIKWRVLEMDGEMVAKQWEMFNDTGLYVICLRTENFVYFTIIYKNDNIIMIVKNGK